MNSPLRKKTILLTRPEESATPWRRKLERRGAFVEVFPTFKLEKIEFTPPPPGDFDLLVFTSANGANFFFQSLNCPKDTQLPPIACVGKKTASQLSRLGHPPDYISPGTTALELGQFLAERFPLSRRKILFPTSARHRPELPEFFRKKGAKVEILPIYRPVPSGEDPRPIARKIEGGEIHAALFASPSAAEFFTSLLREKAGISPQKYPVLWVAIGPTTAETMRQMGYSPVHTSPKPSIDGIIELLEQLFHSERPPNPAK